MIIFGTGARVLPHAVPLERSCMNCNHETIDLKFVQRWAHVFWVPVFPLEKIGVVECPSCGYGFQETAMNDEDKGIVKAVKKEVSTPWWTFLGLNAIPLYILFAIIMSWSHGRDTEAFLADPIRKDVYIMKSTEIHPEYPYLLLRVERIAGDSLWFSTGNMTFASESDAVDIANKKWMKDFNYSTEESSLSRADLNALLDNEMLERIIRNE